jgi:hypothetical protein
MSGGAEALDGRVGGDHGDAESAGMHKAFLSFGSHSMKIPAAPQTEVELSVMSLSRHSWMS